MRPPWYGPQSMACPECGLRLCTDHANRCVHSHCPNCQFSFLAARRWENWAKGTGSHVRHHRTRERALEAGVGG